MIILRTTFRLPNYNGSFVIVMKPKEKHGIRAVAMLLLFIRQGKCLSRSYYHTVIPNPTLSGATVVPPQNFARLQYSYHARYEIKKYKGSMIVFLQSLINENPSNGLKSYQDVVATTSLSFFHKIFKLG
jgi:hypothetical protein